MATILGSLLIVLLILLAALALGIVSRVVAGCWAGTSSRGDPAEGHVGLAALALRGAEVEIRELRPGAAQPMGRLVGEVDHRRRVETEAGHRDPMISRLDVSYFGLR